MHYFIVDYIQEKGNGFRPALPDGIEFLLLADPGSKCLNRKRWGLFHCRQGVKKKTGVLPISEQLHDLLISAGRYPPAIARTRIWVVGYCEGKTVSREGFLQQYKDLLHHSLQKQATDRYILAEAASKEIGYITSGEFYWVLKYYPESHTVSWMSDDYCIYTNPVTDFKLDQKALQRLTTSGCVRNDD